MNEIFAFKADGTIGNQSRGVDLNGNNSANGGIVQTWDCNKGPAQTDSGPIKHAASGKCVDIPDCNGSLTQNWSVSGTF